MFKLKNADGGTTCWSATCTASWAYDAQDRLVMEDPGTSAGAAPTSYSLDTIGNAATEGTTTRTFSGQKLTSQTAAGTTVKYLYDSLGNVACTVANTYVGSGCPAPGSSLYQSYTYDYKNRLVGYANYNLTASAVDSASYLYDALDRPQSETEAHTSPASNTTTGFQYLGDTNAATLDTVSGTTATSKKYAYAADGQRITTSDGTSRLSYLYNPHGDVSLLLDQANTVKASYGYSAYGSANAAITKTASGFSDRNLESIPVPLRDFARTDSLRTPLTPPSARRVANGLQEGLRTPGNHLGKSF